MTYERHMNAIQFNISRRLTSSKSNLLRYLPLRTDLLKAPWPAGFQLSPAASCVHQHGLQDQNATKLLLPGVDDELILFDEPCRARSDGQTILTGVQHVLSWLSGASRALWSSLKAKLRSVA